jgi:hypothetical protein
MSCWRQKLKEGEVNKDLYFLREIFIMWHIDPLLRAESVYISRY